MRACGLLKLSRVFVLRPGSHTPPDGHSFFHWLPTTAQHCPPLLKDQQQEMPGGLDLWQITSPSTYDLWAGLLCCGDRGPSQFSNSRTSLRSASPDSHTAVPSGCYSLGRSVLSFLNYFMWMSVYVCAPCVHLVPRGQEEGNRDPGTGVQTGVSQHVRSRNQTPLLGVASASKP